MEGRRFEWTVVPTGTEAEIEERLSGFQNWNLLPPNYVEDMIGFSPVGRLDWMLRTFSIFVTDMPPELGFCFECHMQGLLCEDTYKYRLAFFDHHDDGRFTEHHRALLASYSVALREVARCPLIVHCDLRIQEENLEATFFTLGGREFSRFSEPWDNHEVMCGSYLYAFCKEAATREGLVKGMNQGVSIFLNGDANKFLEGIVVWLHPARRLSSCG